VRSAKTQKRSRPSAILHISQGAHEIAGKRIIRSQDEKFGYVPVKVVYHCENGCKPAREVREHDDAAKKGEFFKTYDLGRVREIEAREIPHWYPRHKMMNVEDDLKPWGDKWRAGTSSFRTVAELFTKRNLWALAALRSAISRVENDAVRDALMFALTGIMLNTTRMCKDRGKLGISNGTYYLPQVFRELVVTNSFCYKLDNNLFSAFAELVENEPSNVCISTQSSTKLAEIQANTIDYIFTDPPTPRRSSTAS
jgi:hypothetical protein